MGHRSMHGGLKYCEPQHITAEMLKEPRGLGAFDPEHLPNKIRLIEVFSRRFLDVPRVACFATAFHHELPPVERLLPIPRRYEAQGLRHAPGLDRF